MSTWNVGITAVPQRARTLLPITLQSLHNAGFVCPYVFMDGECDDPPTTPTAVYFNHPNIGHLKNWLTSLYTLYLLDPQADYYALFEDDCIACSNLREYIERTPYPERGYLNLLTHDQNLVVAGPTQGWHPSNQMGRGAVGLVFNNGTMIEYLTQFQTLMAPIPGQGQGMKGADGVTISVLKPLGFIEYIHNPSLLQHLGAESTLGHKYREIESFPGEDYDPRQLLG